jgi:NAD(P)-dependent dehydrogenase (short-subunit alcohol dehydrogenase family)
VNSVAPTYVMTPELQARIDSGQRDLAKMMSVHTLDRLPTPGDVAEVIAFLCSPAASCITGVLLPVDSGWSVGVSYMSYAGGVPWLDA